MAAYKSLLSPFSIRHLTLKNRVYSAAHAPMYTQDGLPQERYQHYHEEKAKGGIGLSIFGGSSNISRDSGSIYGQIYVGDDRVIPHFRTFADRMHRHGAALMCQITHMGRRTSWDSGDWFPTMGPSVIRDPAHHSVPRAMNAAEIRRVVQSFSEAAYRCKEGGLDGCELLATTHLLGQFLSPLSNQRDDDYGGSLENRMRFLLEALEATRAKVGDDFIVGVRFAADESNEHGLTPKEGIEIARTLGEHGATDFLDVNGAYGGTTHGMAETFPGMAFKSVPYIELARRVKEASGLPVMQSARLSDLATANYAIEAGYLDLAGMTRPLIADPHLLAKLERNEEAQIRPCVGAGYCMDRVYAGKDSLCLHNVSTGREQSLPHDIALADQPRHVVVVGGGVAGLEAARVSALRGHRVTLFEVNRQLGGQVILAAKAGWRKEMIGISDWLAAEIKRLGVDIHIGVYAEQDEVLAENPDVVIVATGGIPHIVLPDGGDEHVVTIDDVLSGAVRPKPGSHVLVYDEAGGHAAISLADHLAESGITIELMTTDREVGRDVGGLNYPIYLRNLYRNGAMLTPDHRLIGVKQEGSRKIIAKIKNDYSRMTFEREYDLVVVDQLTVPADEVFDGLAPAASNYGLIDAEALVTGKPQPAENPKGKYQLFRVGDAVANRNIYAALLDANRLCRAL